MGPQTDNWIKVAERITSEYLGTDVRLGEPEGLGGKSNVFRCPLLEATVDAPAAVVVKVALEDEIYDPDSLEGYAPRLFNDWAGYEFLTAQLGEASPAPIFFGGDRDAGVIVIQDLGRGTQLDHLLLGDDAQAAETGLVALAATLGEMHAATIGRRVEFDTLRARLGPTNPDTYEYLLGQYDSMIETLELQPKLEARRELELVVEALEEPGPFLAFTHGDPCPDNCMWVDTRMRLLDFEAGRFRHALRDGVYGRIHFPTCWCVNRIPQAIVERMEVSYREQLGIGCPEALDDSQYHRAVVIACAGWTVNTWFPGLLVESNRKIGGLATLRQRFLRRLEVFYDMTASLGELPHLGTVIGDALTRGRDLWLAECGEMSYFAAFEAEQEQ